MLGYLNGSLVASLLTLASLGVIFAAAFTRLWKTPPEMTVSVILPDNLVITLSLPDAIKLSQTLQHIPATVETEKSDEEPIPEDVLMYIEQESDTWARDARKRRARMLKAETGNWDAAFRLLQSEDSSG